MKKLASILTPFLLTITSTFADEIPPQLEGWQDWVLEGHEQKTCPRLQLDRTYQCAMPTSLDINLQKTSADFKYMITTHIKQDVQIPGDNETWPINVKLGDKNLPVFKKNELPYVSLDKGTHTITGVFKWNKMPHQLSVPHMLALIHMSQNGKDMPYINRPNPQRVWLQEPTRQDAPVTIEPDILETDGLDVEIFRMINDGTNPTIETQMRLKVSGKPREETFKNVVLAQTILSNAPYGQLPARINKNGDMTVLVSPGVYDIYFQSRFLGKVDQLTLQENTPTESEFWFVTPNESFRSINITGVDSVDASQLEVNQNWKTRASYRLSANESLQFETLRMGQTHNQANTLNLNRNIYPMFSTGDLVIEDQINGQMYKDWKLSTSTIQLERAEQNGKTQSIHQTENGEGIEVRNSYVNNRFIGKLASALSPFGPFSIPASGWEQDMQQVNTTLHLPRGWQALAVWGSDHSYGTWFDRWDLYDLFFLILVGLAAGKLWGPRWGIAFFVSFGLLFHESVLFKSILLTVIATSAILSMLPKGKFFSFVGSIKRLAIIAYVVTAVPLIILYGSTVLYPSNTSKSYFNLPSSMQGYGTTTRMNVAAAPMRKEMRSMGMAAEMDSAIASVSKFSTSNEGIALEEVAQKIDTFDPNYITQTGISKPNWSGDRISFGWRNNVKQSDQATVLALSPLGTRIFAILKIIMLLIMGQRLMNISLSKMGKFAAIVALMFMTTTGSAQASDIPSQDVLNQLRDRLLKAPTCTPTCVHISQADITIDGQSIAIKMLVNAAEEGTFTIPNAGEDWQPNTVMMGDKNATLIKRGLIYGFAPKGVHNVTVKGTLPQHDTVNLLMGSPINVVNVDIKGWNTSDPSMVKRNQTLTLQRTSGGITPSKPEQTPSNTKFNTNTYIPPFVQLTRALNLGSTWYVNTSVQIQSGEREIVKWPLLPGESVMSEHVKVNDMIAEVELTRKRPYVNVQSVVEPIDLLTLAPSSQTNAQTNWNITANDQWQISYDGATPVHVIMNNQWQPYWTLLPNDTVNLRIKKLAAVDGSTMTIHQAQLNVTQGDGVDTNTLSFSAETTKPQMMNIQLPETANVEIMRRDGRNVAFAVNNGKVDIPLNIGRQNIDLTWKSDSSNGYVYATPSISFNGEMANVNITIKPAVKKWVLWTWAPQTPFGTHIMIWGLLIGMAVLSLVLAKIPQSPLKAWQWFLLSVGFTQIQPLAILIPAAWVFAHVYRKTTVSDWGSFKFNVYQLMLIVLSVATASVILVAVQSGLIGTAKMYASSQSYGQLSWYFDYMSNSFNQAYVFTLPIWAYRVIMLVWAAWVALTVINLTKWGWESFSHGSYWKPFKAKVKQ